MCAATPDHRRPREFITAQEVEKILAAEPSTELPALPPQALFPYVLVHVADDSIDTLRSKMDAVMRISGEFATHREAVLASILFLTFPGKAENIAARECQCKQFVERIRSEFNDQCRIVAGNIRGHLGMLSERSGWFGLLCPHVERVFERLRNLPLGSVAHLDLG